MGFRYSANMDTDFAPGDMVKIKWNRIPRPPEGDEAIGIVIGEPKWEDDYWSDKNWRMVPVLVNGRVDAARDVWCKHVDS